MQARIPLALLILSDCRMAQMNKFTKLWDMSRSISCHGHRCQGNLENLLFLDVIAKNRNMGISLAHIK